MRVWLVTIGEPLPVDDGDPRIMRAGLLARELTVRGHEVVWWSSRFDHTNKRHRSGKAWRTLPDGSRLRLLRSCGYASNVSARRWIDHALLSVAFVLASVARRAPEVIVASLPPPELALAATLRCRAAHRIVDVRDKWPDVLLSTVPSRVRRLGLAVMGVAARSALRRADTIWASSEPYLEWGVHQAGRAQQPADAVIPHGYDAPNARPPKRPCQGPLQLVFAGALTEWFDFDAVARALAMLNERTLKAQLTICGDGERAVHLRHLAGARQDINVVGFLDRAGLWEVFSRSDIGIAPYVASSVYDDSLPNKIIEYCAAGLVVATSIRGTARELIVERGAGFGYDNSDELRACLENLYAERAGVAELSRNASALFEARFVAANVYANAAQRIELAADPSV